MKKIFALVLIFITLCILKIEAQTKEKSKIEQYFDNIAQFGFSGSVMIGDANGIIFHNGYGFSDQASNRKNNSHTVYTISSINKLITATLIMKLVSEKHINLDDKISKFIADVPVKC